MKTIDLYQRIRNELLTLNNNVWSKVEQGMLKFHDSDIIYFERDICNKNGTVIVTEIEWRDKNNEYSKQVLNFDPPTLVLDKDNFNSEMDPDKVKEWLDILDENKKLYINNYKHGDFMGMSKDGLATFFIE